MSKLKIEYIREVALKKYQLELLSENYVANSVPLKWKYIKTGEIFYKSWHNVTSGQTRPPRKLDSYEKVKEFIESYKGLGYTYKLSEEDYLNEEVKKGNRVYSITNKEMPGTWKTTLSNFKRRAEVHLNKSGKSYGEILVKTVLFNNKIVFEEQKVAMINNHLHRFDFYLPEYNTYIEYDGEQHYKESSGFLKGKLELQKKKDLDKDNYVASIGSKLIRIPYTNDTQEGVKKVISSELGIDLILGKIYKQRTDKEIVDVYLISSLVDAANELQIDTTTVTAAFKRAYGMTKREYLKRGGS